MEPDLSTDTSNMVFNLIRNVSYIFISALIIVGSFNFCTLCKTIDPISFIFGLTGSCFFSGTRFGGTKTIAKAHPLRNTAPVISTAPLHPKVLMNICIIGEYKNDPRGQPLTAMAIAKALFFSKHNCGTSKAGTYWKPVPIPGKKQNSMSLNCGCGCFNGVFFQLLLCCGTEILSYC